MQEKTLRVYSRNSDPVYVRAVHAAFESWVKGRFGSRVATSTPSKPPKPPAPPAVHHAAAAAAAGLGDGAAAAVAHPSGGKRTRGLFAGASSDDDISPSCLMKAKQPRN